MKIRIKTGLKIRFIYKGKEQTEDIYGGQNEALFNFKCLYPGAQVIDFESIYREI